MIRLRTFLFPVAAVAFLSAASPPSRPPPLLPLKKYDANKIDASGCAFSFERADRKAMFTSVGNTLLVRTRVGLSQCNIPGRAFNLFRAGQGSVTCGGQRLSLRKVGKRIDPREGSEEDGSSFPARLTIGNGRAAVTLSGDAATAC